MPIIGQHINKFVSEYYILTTNPCVLYFSKTSPSAPISLSYNHIVFIVIFSGVPLPNFRPAVANFIPMQKDSCHRGVFLECLRQIFCPFGENVIIIQFNFCQRGVGLECLCQFFRPFGTDFVSTQIDACQRGVYL